MISMKHNILTLFVATIAASAASAETAKLVPQAQALSEFGKCILGQAPEKSKALMATGLDTPQEYKLARQLVLANNGCVKKYASLSMQTGQIRGAIAETILVSDVGRMKQFASAPLAAAVRPEFAEGRAFVYSYAKCLAAADTPKSAALIQTPHGSPAERQAFVAYGETVSSCMPLSARYKVNIPDVRNHIAVVLYAMTEQTNAKVAVGG
jgi:hypothetical protein